MASSEPPATEATPSTPRHEPLDSVAAQVAAIDLLIGLAQRTIRVFDIDLSEMGWNTVARCEGLTRYLRRSRLARLEIIVHDTRYLERSCARLRDLQRKNSDAIAIFSTGPEARGAMDPLVIVDNRHYLHRFNVEHPKAALGVDQPRSAQALTLRFNDIWASREGELPATTLGL